MPIIRHYLPNNFDTYIEPFFGGGALFFDLEPKKAIINDINSKLINFYKDVANNSEMIIRQIDSLCEMYKVNNREKLYYELRDAYNNDIQTEYLDSVIYWFINKTAFSGMTRINSKGKFNVPFGKYKTLNNNISNEHINLLKSASIYNDDFENILKKSTENDFLFLDPPYDCVFHNYGNIVNDFTENSHRRLARTLFEVKGKYMMIINKSELTVELYKDRIIKEYKTNYSTVFKDKSSPATHLIITNYNV